ncbi:MAG: nuclease, partial [Verrucomicrobia bacterium]|nr:nuclease [Verrucomicrobiota bacterium]
MVIVFIEGIGDISYRAFDLDGYSTDANGYFVLGNAAVPNVDMIMSDASLRDGENNIAHAVALYVGNASDFPNGTGLRTSNLIDAMIYDKGDANDTGLQALLNPGQPQVNENLGGDSQINSMQRCPNGSGGARNTYT